LQMIKFLVVIQFFRTDVRYKGLKNENY
jgi:hypothetical protein